MVIHSSSYSISFQDSTCKSTSTWKTKSFAFIFSFLILVSQVGISSGALYSCRTEIGKIARERGQTDCGKEHFEATKKS